MKRILLGFFTLFALTFESYAQPTLYAPMNGGGGQGGLTKQRINHTYLSGTCK